MSKKPDPPMWQYACCPNCGEVGKFLVNTVPAGPENTACCVCGQWQVIGVHDGVVYIHARPKPAEDAKGEGDD